MKSDRTHSDPLARIIAYHQTSKHHLDRYAPGPGGLDWANQPDPFRRYAGAPRVELPFRADTLLTSFESVRRGERPTADPLERDSLAILFELSLGLSAWKQHAGSRWALRCNPSSGNLHPTEGYLVCPGQVTGSSLAIKHILFDRFEPVHRAANGRIVHTKMVCDFLQGVNAGEESACHRFAAGGIGARLVLHPL